MKKNIEMFIALVLFNVKKLKVSETGVGSATILIFVLIIKTGQSAWT
jgi:hypothetical protein